MDAYTNPDREQIITPIFKTFHNRFLRRFTFSYLLLLKGQSTTRKYFLDM